MPHQSNLISLREKMFFLVLLLILLTWIQSLFGVFGSWMSYREAQRTLRTNAFVDLLLQGAQNIAFERGRTNVLLNAAGLPSETNLAFLADRRSEASKYLDPLFSPTAIDSRQLPARVRDAYAALRELRIQVDSALAVSHSERDPALAEAWFKGASSLIDELAQLAVTASLRDAGTDRTFRGYSRLKVSAFRLRNILGMEASRIAASVSSGRSLSSEEFGEIMFLRGQGASEWENLDRERSIAADPAVDAAVLAVDEAFFLKFRPLQDQALLSLRTPSVPPVPIGQLTGASVPALDSISFLMSVLADETKAAALKTLEANRRALILQFSFAALALASGGAAVLFLIRRVFNPLVRIGDQLVELASGNLEIELGPLGRKGDELARGHAALVTFRDSLLERRALQERLEHLSSIDGLTGIGNRRKLEEVIRTETQRALRQGGRIALVMIDVDLFKHYNDRYGHLAGDDCLRRVADTLAAHVRRAGDFVARFGGEEFTAVLPGLASDQAFEWADQVRKAVSELGIPHDDSEFGRVTISCGVSSVVPLIGSDFSELLKTADDALYQAKRDGRDRVICLPSPTPSGARAP